MKRLILFLAIGVTVTASSAAYFYANRNVQAVPLSSQADTATSSDNDTTTATVSAAVKQAASTDIEDDLDEIIEQYSDLTIGVSVTDIDNDYTYESGETEVSFRAASTSKILTAVYYMQQVEQRTLSLSTVISGVTAQNLLQRMLNQSDNTAWYTLNSYLGYTDLQTYGRSIGMSSYNSTSNTVKTADMALLLTQLQQGKLINSQHRELLLSYLQNTDNETLIPAVVTGDISLYHKWGTVLGNLHDVALLSKDGHSYAVVIYTNNETDDTSLNVRQKAAIHQITSVIVADLLK